MPGSLARAAAQLCPATAFATICEGVPEGARKGADGVIKTKYIEYTKYTKYTNYIKYE